MKPLKIKSIKYNDNRGYLVEVVPNKIKKRFNYSIITQSKKNVIRGMHYNKKKDEEKLVYILEGKILDVTINLNKGKDYGRIFYNRLKKNDILFIPKGFAHGYLCLDNKNTILYLLNKKYSSKNNSGFNWKDKEFNIKWGIRQPILSIKDKKLGEYR